MRIVGIFFFVQSLYSDVAAIFRKALTLGANTARIHYYLGNVFTRMDKLDQAVVEYKQSIKFNSKVVAPYYNLGIIYLKKKKQVWLFGSLPT